MYKPFPQQINYLTIIPILHWVPLILAWNLIYPSHILSNLEEVQWGNGMTWHREWACHTQWGHFKYNITCFPVPLWVHNFWCCLWSSLVYTSFTKRNVVSLFYNVVYALDHLSRAVKKQTFDTKWRALQI